MQFRQIEPLELRRLLAAVSWDGGGDGVNFTDPLNWSTDALPTAADDVTVDAPGTPALRLAGGTVNMRSLVLREPLRVEAGGTLVIATTAQSDLSIELDGGALQGGAWTFGFAGALVASTNTNNRLQVVQSVTGDVLLNLDDASLTVSGSLAVNGTIRLGGRDARLTFSGFNTLSAGTIRFQSLLSSSAAKVSTANGTLMLGSAVVVNAAPGAYGEMGGGDIVNQGTIHMESGAQLRVSLPLTGTFVNEGDINAVGSGSLVSIVAPTLFTNAAGATLATVNGAGIAIQGTDGGVNVNTRLWKNLGTIVVNNGGVTLGGSVRSDELGTFNRNGGTVRLIGALDNTGRTFTPPATSAPWALSGGHIIGGTVNMSLPETASGLNIGRLVGPMVFNGDISAASLDVAGGIDLNGTATVIDQLTLDGSQTIAGGTWRLLNPLNFPAGFQPSVHLTGGSTVTLGPDVTLEAAFASIGLRFGTSGAGTLINEGAIILLPTGRPQWQSEINPGNAFINSGTLRIADGGDAIVEPGGTGFLNEGLVQVGTSNNQTKLVIQGLFSNVGTLDVNALVELSPVSAGLLAATADQTATGYNGGTWDGAGIRSSRAAASPGNHDAVGYDVWQTPQPHIRLLYTRLSDADVNGTVNLADFNRLASGFGTNTDARWNQGDFNFDRRVNLNDFNLLAANFGGSIFAGTAGAIRGDDMDADSDDDDDAAR